MKICYIDPIVTNPDSDLLQYIKKIKSEATTGEIVTFDLKGEITNLELKPLTILDKIILTLQLSVVFMVL